MVLYNFEAPERDDLVAMLRTPAGCVPPSRWELAAATEIERLRLALRNILDASNDPYKIAREALNANQ